MKGESFMPRYTVPNQRVIKIHREAAKSDFLGIKNENWQAAACDLGAHALMLYLYLAANADGYNLALSPAAINQAIGMARSTYHDQFRKLVNKGYLVQGQGNSYDFFEKPQPRGGSQEKSVSCLSADGYDFENCTADDVPCHFSDKPVLPKDIEINNNEVITNVCINNTDSQKQEELYPEKVIYITPPKAERKKDIKLSTQRKEFTF